MPADSGFITLHQCSTNAEKFQWLFCDFSGITPHPALRATFPPRGEGFSGSDKVSGQAIKLAVPKGFPRTGEAVTAGD
jgi:hypothetical protein